MNCTGEERLHRTMYMKRSEAKYIPEDNKMRMAIEVCISKTTTVYNEEDTEDISRLTPHSHSFSFLGHPATMFRFSCDVLTIRFAPFSLFHMHRYVISRNHACVYLIWGNSQWQNDVFTKQLCSLYLYEPFYHPIATSSLARPLK